ncbi:uncharacterized protein [Littorina saxatilis]|uniref:uncharacterized protein n=1 Tax=Littorina saxatilis TaxID=31220 RepID=UPI0038B47DC6
MMMPPKWTVIVSALVLVACVTSSPIDSEEKRIEKRQARPCFVEGRRYNDLETFTYPGFSRCVQYQCLDGRYHAANGACEWNGRCVAEGAVFSEACRSLRCVRVTTNNVHYYQMEPTEQDKCKVEGRCVSMNVPFQHTSSCQRYTCVSLGRGGYEFRPVGPRGCRDEINSRCVDVNKNFSAWVDGNYYNSCLCQIGGSYQCNG